MADRVDLAAVSAEFLGQKVKHFQTQDAKNYSGLIIALWQGICFSRIGQREFFINLRTFNQSFMGQVLSNRFGKLKQIGVGVVN